MQVEPTAMQAKQQRGMGQRRERGYDQCESLGTSITAGLRQHDGRGGREIGEDREQGKQMGGHVRSVAQRGPCAECSDPSFDRPHNEIAPQ